MPGQDLCVDDVFLPPGANRPLPTDTGRLDLVVGWSDEGSGADVDASALLVTADRRVRSDADLVFFNQPASPEGAVHHLGRTAGNGTVQERITIDLDTVPGGVDAVVVAASRADGTFGILEGLRLLVQDGAGVVLAECPVQGASTETAMVLGEVYRHAGTWKIRSISQGWDSGLAGLARDYGVSVEDGEEGEDAAGEDQDVADDVGTGEAVAALTASAPDATDGPPAAASSPAPSGVERSNQRPSARKGVSTRRPSPAPAAVPQLRLAGEGWQSARVFSVSGVGTAAEQEKRATSALLATMMAVKPFARALTAPLGAPAGALETYLEVPFDLGESRVYPNGVLRVARAGAVWTCLVEVKTGDGRLTRAQVENYLDVARAQGFDAVLTLSNEIPPVPGEHPVPVDGRKLRSKVALHHLSWAEVVAEARTTLAHRGAGDALAAWLLHELVRYLDHPRSGVTDLDDAGPAWVPVREAVTAGSLRAGDRQASVVALSWVRLVRVLALRLSAELGVAVVPVLPRRLATDGAARVEAVAEHLVASGAMEATLRIPGAAGSLSVVADLRTGQVRTSAKVEAPQEGGSQRRVGWLVRQLKDAPGDVLVDVSFGGRAGTTCEPLAVVREKPAAVVPERGVEVAAFTLTRTTTLGTKRSGVRGAFIPSVTEAVEGFYATVLQPLRAWVPPAPRLVEEGDAPAAPASGPVESGAG